MSISSYEDNCAKVNGCFLLLVLLAAFAGGIFADGRWGPSAQIGSRVSRMPIVCIVVEFESGKASLVFLMDRNRMSR